MTATGDFEQPEPIDILDTAAAGSAAIRGAGLRTVGFVLGVGLSVVGAALLIRHLGPADFGRYTAVISLVTILASLAEAGMTTIGVREFSVLPPASGGSFVSGLAGLRLLSTFAGVLIAVVFAVVAGYDRDMVAGTAIAGLAMMFLAVQTTWSVPLQSQLRLGWVTLLELIRQVVAVTLIAALVFAGLSLLPFFWVVAVSTLVGLLITVPLVRGKVPLRPSLRGTDWRRILALTIPFAAANSVGAVYAYLAVVLLSVISTAEETGFFGASFRIFIVLAAIPGLIVASAFPILARAARDDADRLAYALQRLWEILLLLGVGVALCTAVGAQLALEVVAGAEFEASVEVLQIQSLALLGSFLFAGWGFALLSLSLYRGILIANAAALLVSFALVVALAQSHGAVGAAFATVGGETALAAGYAFALFRRRPDLRVSLAIVPKVAVALAAASAVALIPGLSPELRLLAVAGVYALVAWLVGAVPAELAAALRPRHRE